jgi:hypothetical protein
MTAHAFCFSDDVYLAAGHAVHCVEVPVPYVPAQQFSHDRVDGVEPSPRPVRALAMPATQALALQPTSWPVWSWYWCVEHAVHDVWPVAGCAVPTAQEAHVAALVAVDAVVA